MWCHAPVCYEGDRVVMDCVNHRLCASMIERMEIYLFGVELRRNTMLQSVMILMYWLSLLLSSPCMSLHRVYAFFWGLTVCLGISSKCLFCVQVSKYYVMLNIRKKPFSLLSSSVSANGCIVWNILCLGCFYEFRLLFVFVTDAVDVDL